MHSDLERSCVQNRRNDFKGRQICSGNDRSAGSISDPDNSANESTLSSRRSLSDKPTGSRIVDVRILVVAAAVIICTAAVFFLIRFKRLSK